MPNGDNNDCIDCETGCKSCVAPETGNCLATFDEWYLDDTAPAYATQCPAGCLTCSSDTVCTSCKAFLALGKDTRNALLPFPYDYRTLCAPVKSCGDGKFKDATNSDGNFCSSC